MLLWSGLHPRIMATQTSLDTLSRKLTRRLGYSRYLLELHKTHMLHQIGNVDMNLTNPDSLFIHSLRSICPTGVGIFNTTQKDAHSCAFNSVFSVSFNMMQSE